MSPDEIQDFIDQVKGKKIRWADWRDKWPRAYIIPTGRHDGECFDAENAEGEILLYVIRFGFHQFNNGKWELIEDNSDERKYLCDFEEQCQHSWVKYAGLRENFDYCSKCDAKK